MSITAAITNGRSCNTYIRHHQFALCACLDHHQLSMVSFNVQCSASGGKRGFGRQSVKKEKTNKSMAPKEQKSSASQPRKSTAKQFDTVFGQEPGVNTRLDAKYNNIASDLQFEERLEAVRRSAIEQKKEAESKQYGAIDYDSPVESDKKTIGFGTKVGVGVAVAVFGLVFALGDFLPTGSVSPVEDATVVNNKLTDEEKVTLQTRLQQYEATLNIYPKDQTALEGAAVTLAELGDYSRAASLLENLIKERPNDPDAYRLLGEVKYELKDYEGSAAAYKSSASMSKTVDFEVLRGLTNAFLASQKPDEAVQVLLAFRERLSIEDSNSRTIQNDASSNVDKEIQKVDPIQVELLLGKAYSDWGHVSDAVSVYDRLISTYPNDFRGYLAKGIILKENGSIGDAERMFIQARFFAPEKAKVLVDRYSRQ